MAKKPSTITDHAGAVQEIREKIEAAQETEAATRNARPGAEIEINLATMRIEQKAAAGLEQAQYWGRSLGQTEGRANLFGEAFFLSIGKAPGEGNAVAGATGRVNLGAAENVLVALHKVEMTEITVEAIRKSYESWGGLIIPPAELPARIKKAEQTTFALEQQEEARIEQAEAVGLSMLRRPDATPEAVLGLAKGAGVPHDWNASKFDRLADEAEACHARIEAAREQLRAAQRDLVVVEGRGRDARWEYREDREDYEASLKAAKEQVAYRQQVLAERMADAEPRITLAARLKDFVAKNRQPKPCRPHHNPELRHPGTQPAKPENWPARFDN